MKMNTKITLCTMMFIQFFIWGVWFVTMGTYLGKLGFEGSDISGAYSTTAWAAILSPLFVGMIADRFFYAEKVLGVMHILGAVAMFFAAKITDPTMFFWVLLLYTLCYMPTLALVNTIAFNQMTNPEKDFPPIRVLGTLGWIVAGLLVGFMKVEASAMPMQLAAGASLLMGIYSFFLPKTPPQAKGQKASIKDLLGLDSLALMKDRSFAIYVVCSMLICIPLTFYYNFTNPFFNESGMEYAAAKMSMGQMSEILFMLVMPFFFARLGVKKMLLIGMLAWVARYALFAFGNNDSMVWMFYGGILLHGICYDFFFVTGQIYVDNAAPKEMRSNAQGFNGLITYGIGMLIGAKVSGPIVDYYQIMEGDVVVGHHWKQIWLIPCVMAMVIVIIFALLFKDKAVEAAPEVDAEPAGAAAE